MNPQTTVETNPSHQQTLSAQLRHSTMSAHKNAETGGFIRQLFSGKCSTESYIFYLWALKQVYTTLEKALTQHQQHPVVKPIYFQELFREASLDSDLKNWTSSEQINVPDNLKIAVGHYTDRIQEVSHQSPALLVAHSYVRYLGDLSGGQMLAKALSRNKPKANGYSFYEFKNVEAEPMKHLYRQRLDAIGFSHPELTSHICDEACLVFDLNNQVFTAL